MFNRKSNDMPELNKALVDALEQLDSYPASSEEYHQIINQIERLNALKAGNSRQSVSPDTLAIVVGNLLGIVVIVGHERAHIVTSKALGFVLKAVR